MCAVDFKPSYDWKGKDSQKSAIPTVKEGLERISRPNPFAGSRPHYGGFQKTVNMVCHCCGESRVVITDDFRLNWECKECKETPVLLRVLGKYARSTGILPTR